MLTVHRSERADRLVEALASILIDPLDDPFTPEVIAVPTRGVERWITQRLSTMLGTSPGRHDGVCANVQFPFPGRLADSALAAATGVDPDTDPWTPERAVWPLLAVVDDRLGEPWLAPLATHLGGSGPDADEARRGRRFGAVRHLADLFDHYSHHRPELIGAWAAGDDTDGRGTALPADLLWQPALWRLLRARIGTPSRAERLPEACATLRDQPDLVDLPARLSFFGLTRLAAGHVEVLDALGATREIHLFLLHPSPVLWDSVAEHVQPGETRPLPRRRDDSTASLPKNPLLATWGRDARELQLVAGRYAATDIHHPITTDEGTLLRRLQTDIRADRVPPGAPLPGAGDARMPLDPTDRSVQVHSCHGRNRQVEVLRDALLHLLADDPTLEPRDVIVMCPDIEAFAPLIHATFGSGEVDDEAPNPLDVAALPDLRVRLADRSLRQTNAVLGVVADLLALADSRMKASDVVDLASRDPVRRRFRLDDDDLARIDEWVAGAGIRWGLDAARRRPFQLDSCAENTWRAGLDRLLVGVTMAEEDLRLVDDVLPLDDVDSGDIDLAGRLSELVARLDSVTAALRDPQSIGTWVDAIASAADALTATSQRDAWQRDELARLLDDLVDESSSADMPLALAEVRTLLADRLRGRPTRANFRTGHLTMCTLVPMRSVPHRVVCLLGLDDGAFPRRTAPDGDNIIERDPCVGDRDVRSEDRQLLLDAVLAATDHLVVTYCGHDERTNAVVPPAVPLGELLDVIDATARTATGPARGLVVIEHPLQTFDDRNFGPGMLAVHRDRPWSFDTVALDGAQARRRGRRAESPFLPAPLAALDDPLVEVDDLVRFVQHPVKAFLRSRLGLSLSADESEPDDAMPVQLDGLSKWAIGQRLVENLLAGHHRDDCVAAERARGGLPPGLLGDAVLNEVEPQAQEIVSVANSVVAAGEITSVEVDVTLADGRSLVGSVNHVVGDIVRVVTYSRVGAKHRLAAWVRLLALSAAHPDRPFSAATVGRGRNGVGVATIAPLDAGVAIGHLAVLLDLHARGMREPLPLYCDTSAAYAAAPSGGRSVRARKAWTTPYGGFDLEDRDAAHVLVLGDEVSFDDLELAVPADDEAGPGWRGDVSSRFGRYALRLWEALLTLEQRSGL